MDRKRVAVALSGGVDSAVAVYLLKEAGYNVTGLYMRRYNNDALSPGNNGKAPSNDEAFLLEQVCPVLNISCQVIDLADEFHRSVIDYFQKEYGSGRTPNPCIKCNRRLKFGALFDRAFKMGADYFATGHYAGISFFDERYHLLKGKDPGKDQSYVLYMLDQEKLGRLLFPLVQYDRKGVMTIARRIGIPINRESGSQDLCFIDGDYSRFIQRYYPSRDGKIVDCSGNLVGRHDGIAGYTIGQRRKLHVASDRPLYVTDINPKSNTITIGDDEELYKKELVAVDVNWISGVEPTGPFRSAVKIRYKSSETMATIYPERDTVRISFETAQRAITPGQAAVLYRDDEVIGGGTIEHVA
jgi:tRNA-specific 2-thiouridylase